ncbi:MAG: anaerobic ribonucleoside triphosphate reductase, partial [Clostridiales Family XIII bacterium]|nr:anaerobic ribonucleoside triphosphate reductase [Clostridiales Family XIII bacterium]
MFTTIRKRDGREVPYDIAKITGAIEKAMAACGRTDLHKSADLAQEVEGRLVQKYGTESPDIEAIQDCAESVLMDKGYPVVAKRYIHYRDDRSRSREKNTPLMHALHELTVKDAAGSNMKRDNANIDGDTAMGVMLKYGSESAKDYYKKFILSQQQSDAHQSGDIHIHDFDFYALTTTCCQIDVLKLFDGGFSTGHGHLREPNSIHSYAALACIAIQSNQNDQHGGQSIPNFDFGLAPGVRKTYKKIYILNFIKGLRLLAPESGLSDDDVKDVFKGLAQSDHYTPRLRMNGEYKAAETRAFTEATDGAVSEDALGRVHDFAVQAAENETERETLQAMEALVHNLNTMHSRAGAQTPFSSINYGTDTSPEGQLVTKCVMLATESGLGGGETAIFPIHIFKVKEGVNYNEGDPNYDLFKLACRVSAKRLFPNFAFIDAPFNLRYYREGHPETEVAYMGCRTRVLGNTYDKENEVAFGRGNLSFTSINLPRIAISSGGNLEWFFGELERKLDFVTSQLLDRYR